MPRSKLYQNKPDVFPSVDHVEEQLRQAYDDDMRAVLAFAQKHKDTLTKVTRAKKSPSHHQIIRHTQLLDAKGFEISLPNEPEIPDFNYSAINHEGESYVLLRGNLFYHDCFYDEAGHRTSRGLRRVKLIRDIQGKLFTAKILELPYVTDSKKQTKLNVPVHQEMSNAAHYYQERMPHKTVLQRRKHHPSDSLFEPVKDTIKYYLIQPFTGLDSYQLIHAKSQRLSSLQMLDLAIQYMQLVYTLHEQSLVHRDLKPANYTVEILSDDELNVSIIDFDCAKLLDTQHIDKQGNPYFSDGHYIGTPEYLPPYHRDRMIKQHRNELPQHKAYGYYNFATDMYAATKSAEEVLKKLKKATLSPDEQALNDDLTLFISDIQNTKNEINAAKTFHQSHPHLPHSSSMREQLKAFSATRKAIKIHQTQCAISQPEMTLYHDQSFNAQTKVPNTSSNTTLMQQLTSFSFSDRSKSTQSFEERSTNEPSNKINSSNTSDEDTPSENDTSIISDDASHYDTITFTPPLTPKNT